MSNALRRAALNLLLLVVSVPTVWYLLVLLVTASTSTLSKGAEPLSGYLFFAGVAVPLLLGPGVLQQIAMLFVPARWTPGRRRLAAVLRTAVIFPAFGLVTGFGSALWSNAMGALLAAALFVYAFIMRV